MRRMNQFLVSSKNENGAPVIAVDDFFGFHADLRILTHRVDLASQCAEAVETVVVEIGMNRHDIRLIVTRSREPHDRRATQHVLALGCRQLLNQHREVALSVVKRPIEGSGRGEWFKMAGAPRPYGVSASRIVRVRSYSS